MANVPIDELTTPITRQEFETSMYRVMAAVGLQTSSWKPGAVVRAIVTGMAVLLAALSNVVCGIVRSGFLELSSGLWLRLCARYGFGTDYLPATFAAGTVRIDNTGGGVFDEQPGDMVVLGAEGQEYRNTARVQIAAYQTRISVDIVATAAGNAGGSAAAGTITRFGSNYPGLTVTNPTTLTGEDDESDESLIARAKDNAASISPNGPPEAYRYYARLAKRANGTSLGVNRVRVVSGPGDGTLTVYAATVSGALPGTIDDPDTDLGRLHYLLNTEVAPIGDTPTAASGSTLAINVSGEVWIYTDAGMNTAQAYQAMKDAISAYLVSLDIGGDHPTPSIGYVYLDRLRAEILGAIPSKAAFHCTLTVPSADVVCSDYAVPVAGNISLAVNWVNR